MTDSDKLELADRQADEVLIDYYQAKSLRPELTHELLLSKHKLRRQRLQGPLRIALATAAVAVLAFAGMFIHQDRLGSDRTNLALLEASTNHATKLMFEFEPESVAELEESMDRLKFALRMPSLEELGALKIEGARYCTLSGNLAAHLKFTHIETQEPVSLFVTADVDNLSAINEQPATVSGVDVTLWRERGLFYALAKSSEG